MQTAQTQQHQPLHPIHNSKEGTITTISGKKIDFNNLDPNNIDIMDIAHALGKICRFGGHVNRFYSVAQHSVIVAHLVPENCKKAALLHDASEAYLGDVVKPLKILLGDAYGRIEYYFTSTINYKFGIELTYEIEDEIKRADRYALEIEHECFRKNNINPFMDVMERLHLLSNLDHPAYSDKMAKTMFLGAYELIFNDRKTNMLCY